MPLGEPPPPLTAVLRDSSYDGPAAAVYDGAGTYDDFTIDDIPDILAHSLPAGINLATITRAGIPALTVAP